MDASASIFVSFQSLSVYFVASIILTPSMDALFVKTPSGSTSMNSSARSFAKAVQSFALNSSQTSFSLSMGFAAAAAVGLAEAFAFVLAAAMFEFDELMFALALALALAFVPAAVFELAPPAPAGMGADSVS